MKYLPFGAKLEKCYSAVIMDVLDALGLRVQCLDPGIRPLVPSMRAWGEAVTLYFETVTEVPRHPFKLEMETIDDLQEGQILVEQCNAIEMSAGWGGLLTTAAVYRKAAGVVTDGGVRDYREITGLGFPTFSRGIRCCDSLGRMDAKERSVPIVCGGVRVSPGDLIFADIDGVVVVPQRIAEEVIARAWEKVEKEDVTRSELKAGASLVETYAKYGVL
jgi:regulator of RNase E activity RraA